MKSDAVYLHHILDAATRIETYTGDISEAEFLDHAMIQDAVVRQLEIIGEASRQLPQAFRDRHAYIPWSAIIVMRNRIAHDYLHIDLRVVWEVVQYDLPTLRTQVEDLL